MAHQGQIWKDAVTGDVVEMLETTNDSKGERIQFRFNIKPGGFKPVEHIHPDQDEIFEIIRGKFTYILDGKKNAAGPGDKVILPKGIKHTHYNDEPYVDLEMVQSIVPALDSENLVESILGLSRDGQLKNGEPKFLQVMVWLRHYKAKVYLAKVPAGMQKFLSFVLAPVGRLVGYKAAYKKYSGFDA